MAENQEFSEQQQRQQQQMSQRRLRDMEPEAGEQSPLGRRNRRSAVCGESYDPANDTEALPEPIPKSPEERARLMKAASQIAVLGGLDDRQLNEVIDHLSDRHVNSDDVIVKQGDPGDYFYIIDSGKFEVDIDGIVVSSYDSEGSFGELALYYDQPRAATIKAVTEGRIWQMNRTMFRRLVLRKAHELRQSYNTLIGSVPILQSLDAKDRMTLCDALVPRLYKDGDVIVKQGDQADGMYFLEQGTVNVVVRSKEGREEAVTTLTRGNYFGELALLTQKRRAATVVAKSDVRTAFLDVATFERLLGKCADIMRRNIPHYEEQLVNMFGSAAAEE